MSDYKIRPYNYTDTDAANLARMWNESDDQWPGTFTEGVPMTAERVRQWMARETGLAILVVEDPNRERIVGYGSLWDDPKQEKSCYVPLLNVHPDYQGKSLCRRMLTQMVDQASELHYRLMTIETWSANLKSVPLYKKVGFFWVPDTTVYMENYMPLIRQLAVARPYFERHDWYRTFQRELRQVEDDQQHGAMQVYRYHWAQGDDSLTVLIDRAAKTVTAIETEQLAVYAELDQPQPAYGLSYPIRWRVTNKQPQPVNVSILAGGGSGIHISHQSAFVLPGNQERVIEAHFDVSPEAKPGKKHQPAPCVESMLIVDGQMIKLGCGVRPRPAIDVSLAPQVPVSLPGRSQTVRVQLQNHLDRPLHGVVSLAPVEGLEANWEGLRHAFELDPEGYAALPLDWVCEQAGAVPLHFGTTFEVDGNEVQTSPRRFPCFGLAPGGIVADIGADDRGEVIVAENEFFRLRCQSEGGRCMIVNKVDQKTISDIREELGPPFRPSELREKPYQLSLERIPTGGFKAILRAQSSNFPGLTIAKEITLSASPLITLRYRLINQGGQTHTVQLNPRIELREGEKAHVTLPRAERLVRERAALFGNTHGDLPQKPAGMAERWLAWRVDDLTVGLMWDEQVEKHKWEWNRINFDRPAVTLKPGTTCELPPFYMYAGPGNWKHVRRTWARLSGTSPRPYPKPRHKLELGVEPTPILSVDDQAQATLRVDNLRQLPLQGQVKLLSPPGWQVRPTEIDFQALKYGQPLTVDLQMKAQEDKQGAFAGRVQLDSRRFDVSAPFTLIRLGDASSPVHIAPMVEGEMPLLVIDNGYSRWQIAPTYHGGIVSWHIGDSPVNHLLTAFPQPGGATLGWLKPWFGGIQPILPPLNEYNEGWPGKLHQAHFTAQPCERPDEQGFVWRGLRLSAQLENKRFKGLRAQVEYLTVGKSNVLKIIYQLVNQTAVYQPAKPGVMAYCQVDGRYDNGVLYGEGVQRKRTSRMTWVQSGAWGAVTNPATGRTLIGVTPTRPTSIELSDWGQDGGHLLAYQAARIPPHAQSSLMLYLALTDSLEAAKRYTALAG